MTFGGLLLSATDVKRKLRPSFLYKEFDTIALLNPCRVLNAFTQEGEDHGLE